MTQAIATRRILICEDDPTYRTALHRGLAGEGYAVSEALNGPDAVRMVMEHPCGTYDIVIMDYSLDHLMTGGEAVNAMRQCCPDQPVLFLSGHDLPLDLRRGEAFLQKPALVEQIVDVIERMLRSRAETEPPGAP